MAPNVANTAAACSASGALGVLQSKQVANGLLLYLLEFAKSLNSL